MEATTDAPNDASIEEKARSESRSRRQERKMAQRRAFKTGVWDRCLYRVPGKERYCAQKRSPHSTEYCGTHMGASPCVDKGKRVPCPVDPNHTVFEQQLSSHVKICNLTLQEARMEAQPYYSRGINDGEGGDAWENCQGGTGGSYAEEGNDGGGGGGAARVGEGARATVDEGFVLDVISRVRVAYRDHVGTLCTEVLDPPEVQALHRARAEGGAGFRKGRHVLQQASIVGHMYKRGLVGPDTGMLHVEMGAGKGTLGHAIATAFPGADVTMVERSSVRRKAENRLDGVGTRARIDIRDLNMAGLPSLTGEGECRPVVVVAKHLCGMATDLALRAMLTLPRPGQASPAKTETHYESGRYDPNPLRTTPNASMENPGHVGNGDTSTVTNRRAGGAAIATCCHHVCNWRDYTGRDFLRRLGFTARDFDVMRRVSAWIGLEPESGTRKNNQYPTYSSQETLAPTYSSQEILAPARVSPRPPVPPVEASRNCEEISATVSALNDASASEGCTSESERPHDTHHPVGARGGLPTMEEEDDGTTTVGFTIMEEADDGGGARRSPGGVTGSIPRPEHPRQELAPSQQEQQEQQATLGDDKAPPRDEAHQQQHGSSPHDGSAGVHHAGGEHDDEGPGAFPALTPAEKARAARECKRLLDAGRRAFMEERLGLRSELVHFVGREVTPENALLLGFRGETNGVSGV